MDTLREAEVQKVEVVRARFWKELSAGLRPEIALLSPNRDSV